MTGALARPAPTTTALGRPKPAIALDLGEPRVPLPAPVGGEVARAAAHVDVHAYAPPAGLAALRRLIAERAEHQYGAPVDPRGVTVTHGASGALAAAILALTSPGDTILVPDPGYPAFRSLAQAFGRVPVGYRAEALDAATMSAALDDAAAVAGSGLLVWNSPANPTGAVASTEVCATIAAWARERGTPVVTDDVYAGLVYDGAAASPFPHLGDGPPVVALGSLSKALAAPGLRVGYAVGSEPVVAEISRMHWALNMSVSTQAQRVAVVLLGAGDALAAHVASVLEARRDAAVNVLRAEWLELPAPAAGLFLWLDVSAALDDERQFARLCLCEGGVAVAPGAAFGDHGRGFVRLSFGADTPVVVEGARRVAELHQHLREAR